MRCRASYGRSLPQDAEEEWDLKVREVSELVFALGRLGAGGHARAHRWFTWDSRCEGFRLVVARRAASPGDLGSGGGGGGGEGLSREQEQNATDPS